MRDLISRQAAIEAITRYCALYDLLELLSEIETLPSVQLEQRWIPVSERLPDVRDWVLGTFKESDTGWVNPIPFVCEYRGRKSKFTTGDCWELHGHNDECEFGFDYYRNLECIAWMPLPEPYRKEGEG